MNNNSEDKSSSSPHEKQQQNDSFKAKVKGYKDIITSKKPIKKTQAKLQSQEIEVTKIEISSIRSTTNEVSVINQDAKAVIESNEECKDTTVHISEYQNGMELQSQNDLSQNSALVLNASTPEIVSYEVTVGV